MSCKIVKLKVNFRLLIYHQIMTIISKERVNNEQDCSDSRIHAR